MDIIRALILGIVQGVTEFLPVSSSAHLVVIPEILGWPKQSLEFDIILHSATLLALLLYYRKKIFTTFSSLFSRKRNRKVRAGKLLFNLSLTTIPSIIFFFVVRTFIDGGFKSSIIIALSLFLVGLLLIKSDYLFSIGTKFRKKFGTKSALFVGVFQAAALIRGVSRSGITILGGGLAGLNRKEAAEYAFLAGIPLIGASLIYLLITATEQPLQEPAYILAFGFVAALLSGLFAISTFIRFIETHDLKLFGYYRILLSAVIFILLLT